MKLMPNWMKKTSLLAAVLCVAGAAQADTFLHDEFDDGDPYSGAVSNGQVVSNYWQRFASSAFLSDQPTVTESNGRLHITLPAGVDEGGIMLNRSLYGSTINTEAVGIWQYGGNQPLGNDVLKNTLDPRMHFLDDKTTAAMPSRFIRIKGIESSGPSFDYERGFKVLLYANSQRRQMGSYLRFDFVANRELRVYRQNGTRFPILLMSAFLPNVPSAVEVMVDETEYRISAYYQFPTVEGQVNPLRSGMTVYSGDHGINKQIWMEDMLYGVSTTNVNPRGSTFGFSPFAYDVKDSHVSVDSITLGEKPDTAGDLGFN